MKKVLNNRLRRKYPKILGNRGIDVGDGWYWLLHNLLDLLQFDTDHNKHPQVKASQIKEKFGTLRFYISGGDDTQYGMVSLAELMSASICEDCGSHEAKLRTIKGWKYTRCQGCHDKLKEEKDPEPWRP